jgi:hypothetical protein
MFAKWWKFITKKNSVTSLIFILNFQQNWIRFIMISKIILKSFQINLLFEFFYVFNIGIIKINLKFYSLGIIIFL